MILVRGTSILKKCALLLIFIMLFSMLNISEGTVQTVYADENIENNEDGTDNEDNNEGEEEEGEEEEEEEIIPSDIDFTVDTDGGFEKVASTKYLDLHFDRNEIAIRLDVKDEDGNVVKKWRSQLSPKNFRDLTKINQYDRDSMSFLKFKYINLNRPDSQPIWTTTFEENLNC